MPSSRARSSTSASDAAVDCSSCTCPMLTPKNSESHGSACTSVVIARTVPVDSGRPIRQQAGADELGHRRLDRLVVEPEGRSRRGRRSTRRDRSGPASGRLNQITLALAFRRWIRPVVASNTAVPPSITTVVVVAVTGPTTGAACSAARGPGGEVVDERDRVVRVAVGDLPRGARRRERGEPRHGRAAQLPEIGRVADQRQEGRPGLERRRRRRGLGVVAREHDAAPARAVRRCRRRGPTPRPGRRRARSVAGRARWFPSTGRARRTRRRDRRGRR